MTDNQTGAAQVRRSRHPDRATAGRARQPIRVRELSPGPDTRSAIRILGGTVLPAMFCVHSSTGGVAEFVELAKHLGAGQQLFGLQSRGMVGHEQPLWTVEEMAVAYLEDVVRIQPRGPYLFAAWSMGCYVAVEMARRAAALGHDVGGAFLIAPPHDPVRSRWKLRAEWRTARKHLKSLDHKIEAASDPAGGPERDLLPLWDLDDDPLRDPYDHGAAPAGQSARQRLREERVNLANVWAGIHHRVGRRRGGKPYQGPVTLFVPEDDPVESRSDVVEGWRRVVGVEPEVVTTPGTHWTVIQGAGAAAIGSRLRTEVANWQQLADVAG